MNQEFCTKNLCLFPLYLEKITYDPSPLTNPQKDLFFIIFFPYQQTENWHGIKTARYVTVVCSRYTPLHNWIYRYLIEIIQIYPFLGFEGWDAKLYRQHLFPNSLWYFFLPRGSWSLNSDCQVLWRLSMSTEPSFVPILELFILILIQCPFHMCIEVIELNYRQLSDSGHMSCLQKLWS